MVSEFIESIRNEVVGDQIEIDTPFGKKPLVYADYTASGRSLASIEAFIQGHVLPFYANTHTETSFTGAQTSVLREESREIIRHAVNAGSENKVIFCGSGATAAINKLIDVLNLRLPVDIGEQYSLLANIPLEQRPVVFIGPYEHHSNELPWRESIADVVVIPLNDEGSICTGTLEEELERYQNRPLKIGSFSAASNVTGIKTDTAAIARLLHRYHAHSFWDYAAAAPYVGIDMLGCQDENGDSSMDAVFISPHKFVGGPGTPGILVVNNKLLTNSVPAVPGGGTVVYVTPEDHRFVNDPERREEGGTPGIVESIRAGLVFKLQQSVGVKNIEQIEEQFVQRVMSRLGGNPNIEILGNRDVERLSIFSLRFKFNGKDLHYNFVVALLNDLFGIQARGGCSCAGPYGHELLGMDMDYSRSLESELLKGQMIMRPGWVRLNFNYFICEASFEYILRAVELVAQYGWKILPYYNFDQTSGVWRFQNGKVDSPVSLDDFQLSGDCVEMLPKSDQSFEDLLTEAENVLRNPDLKADQYDVDLPETAEVLRWFVTPQELSSPPNL